MLESEWSTCRDPERMLRFLLGQEPGAWRRLLQWFGGVPTPTLTTGGPRVSSRKLRLFSCACTRLLSDLIEDKRSQAAIDVSERFAYGDATAQELEKARAAAARAADHLEPMALERIAPAMALGPAAGQPAYWTGQAAALTAAADPAEVALSVQYAVETACCEMLSAGADVHSIVAEMGAVRRADLLREIVGPLPFGPIVLDPSCQTPTIKGLARTIFGEREPDTGHLDADRLAILADALEEAGCTNAGLLNHARAPGPHVHGCWVVDLCLMPDPD